MERYAGRFLAQSVMASVHFSPNDDHIDHAMLALHPLALSTSQASPSLFGPVGATVWGLLDAVEDSGLSAMDAAFVIQTLRHDLSMDDATYFAEVDRALSDYRDPTIAALVGLVLEFDHIVLSADGDDTVIASHGNEVIEAGLGNDTLHGLGGNDTDVFNRGDGQDTIDDNGSYDTDKSAPKEDRSLGGIIAPGMSVILGFLTIVDRIGDQIGKDVSKAEGIAAAGLSVVR